MTENIATSKITEPKYKELRFESEEKFQEWLNEKATKKITLEDHHQDFIEFYIDDRGEILHTWPFQTRVWNGKIIIPYSIKEGGCPVFNDGMELKYPIAKIDVLNGQGE